MLSLLFLFRPGTVASAGEPGTADLEFFETTIRPLLHDRCVECHGPKVQKGKLRLDIRAGAFSGGESGPAVEPGKPEESLLLSAVRHEDGLRMPPKSRLSAEAITALSDWISKGAAWPAERTVEEQTPPSGFDLDDRAGHWSFQPVRPSPIPPVRDASWPLSPIDRFLLAGLEDKNLRPAPDVNRRAWLRRAAFDLTGLPPTPAEIAAFLADRSPDAFERAADRLLASPQFGERQARHWLDLVRWAETYGHEFDYDILDVWRYRDYVIRAINADLPYDQFLIEQLAGDLLPLPRRDPATGLNESALGTAFWTLGEGVHSPVDLLDEQMRRIENQVDVFGKATLGLTIACARCHDHKFDAIRQADYYAIAGHLRSSRLVRAVLDPPERFAPAAAELDRLRLAVSDHLEAPRPASAQRLEPSPFAFFSGDSEGWTTTGPAFPAQPTREGEPRLVLDAHPARLERWPAGWMHSGLVSNRLVGVLRSPTFTISAKHVHIRAAGRDGLLRLVVDGFDKIRSPIYGGLSHHVNSEAPAWVSIDVSMWDGHRGYLEVADGAVVDYTGSHSVSPSGLGWIALDEVVLSDAQAPPTPGPGPTSTPIPTDNPALADAIAQAIAVESTLPAPNLALTLADGTPEDSPLEIRGNPHNLGETIPRRFLEVLGGASGSPAPNGSGRLALAEQVVDPGNPLTARVIANRVWARHFGVGLVSTPDDFGAMGRPPSHPELLDWLADWFIREGWSLKRLHRLIVTSRVYRMDSVPADSATEAADPDNALLHRMPLRRLEAEAIRDAMLAVSGRLDAHVGGPSVPPHLTPFMDGRGRPDHSGPLDGDGRRTLYMNIRRNFLPPFLLAFDYPIPTTTIGRRSLSNVPAQALALQNDPMVVALAQEFAFHAAREAQNEDDRITWMFEKALGRPPSDAERHAITVFLDARPHPPSVSDWAELAQTLFNTKEFIYIK